MHGFGSHIFSLINTQNARVGVKVHRHTQQSIRTPTDVEAAAIMAQDRESHQCDLLETIDRGDFPR
jgi:catalase